MPEYDMGQASLIHMIRQCYNLFGIGAIGALRGVGRDIGRQSSLPLEVLEGPVEEIKPGVVGLPTCPFAEAISTFKDCCGNMPEEIGLLADFANGQGGAWVSAFCGIHQSLRNERIGDSYQQIGCRSGPKMNIADQEFMTEEEVKQQLENYACVYAR